MTSYSGARHVVALLRGLNSDEKVDVQVLFLLLTYWY